jgi:antitoxin VapB
MHIAKLFSNGRSQAVRLPKECRFAEGEKEVYVHQFGGGAVMLVPKKNPWRSLLNSLDKFSEDFMADRKQPKHSDARENL